MEGDVFGDSGLFQQFFVQPSDTVWPIELACYRGGEHDGVGGVLAVFLDQQVDGLLRQENCPHRVGGFGLGYLYIAVDPASRLVYCQGLGLQVKVIPEEGHQLTPADARGQFQVEHGEDSVFLRCSEVGADLLRRKGLHLLLLLGRELASCGRVVRDKPFLHRLIQALPEHGVEAADGLVAEAQVLHALVPLDPAFGLGLVVELLDVQGSKFVQLDFADVGHDVLVDIVLVVGGGGFTDGGFGIVLEPGFGPLAYCELACFAGINLPGLLQCRCQLFLALFLGLGQHIFVDGFVGFWVVACCVAALPAAVAPFAEAALAVCPLLGHGVSLLSQRQTIPYLVGNSYRKRRELSL